VKADLEEANSTEWSNLIHRNNFAHEKLAEYQAKALYGGQGGQEKVQIMANEEGAFDELPIRELAYQRS
jgi:hypothetical protein